MKQSETSMDEPDPALRADAPGQQAAQRASDTKWRVVVAVVVLAALAALVWKQSF